MLIKFAVQVFKTEGGFANNYQDVIKGYIISKCQVLEDRKVFYNEENFEHEFLVCFPYTRFDDFCIWLKRKYNYRYYYETSKIPFNNSSETIIVTKLYDKYEDALEEKDEKNNELRANLLWNATYNEYQKISKQFQIDMDLCSDYEKFIYESTKDLEISKINLMESEESTLKLIKK